MNNVTLKFLVSTVLIVVSLNTSFSQESSNAVQKVKYTVLDSDSKSFRAFFGSKSSEIIFKLIELKNLDTDSIIYGVEVNLKTNEAMAVGSSSSSSIAFADSGSLWGFSSGTIYSNITKSGYIFLSKTDMSNILNFLNDIIGKGKQPQEKFTLYKITIRDNFQIGMVYDPDNNFNKKWEFVFQANDAAYRMKYDKGFALLVSLSKFNKFLQKQ